MQGYRCVYAPGARLVHREGASRGMVDRPQEVAAFREKYRNRYDPYYSPYLSLDDGSGLPFNRGGLRGRIVNGRSAL